MSESLQDKRGQRRERFDRGQLIAWFMLGLPLLVYAIVWPIRARLDRGVIERRTGWAIWKRMTDSLPTVGAQTLFEIAFVAGLVLFMAGSLFLVWLALEKSSSAEDADLALDLTHPD